MKRGGTSVAALVHMFIWLLVMIIGAVLAWMGFQGLVGISTLATVAVVFFAAVVVAMFAAALVHVMSSYERRRRI